MCIVWIIAQFFSDSQGEDHRSPGMEYEWSADLSFFRFAAGSENSFFVLLYIITRNAQTIDNI